MVAKAGASKKISQYLPQMIVTVVRGKEFKASIKVLEGALMFADISGFTAISEKLASIGRGGSEELTKIINRHLSGMVSIMISYGGDVLKFGGDATLVYFADPLRAAKAAFRVNEWAKANVLAKTSAGKFELSLHSGLHYGKFFSAEVGNPSVKLEHIVTGEALNMVFTAADFAQKGQVGATAAFIGAVGDCLKVVTGEGDYAIVEPSGEFNVPQIGSGRLQKGPEGDVLLLSKFLPHGLFDKLDTGRDGSISAEHRRVTAMFVNFTIPGDNFMDEPEALKQRLDHYFEMAHSAVSLMGGVITRVDCYSKGDKILAVFGAVTAHQDDDIRALRAAIAMQEGLEKLNQQTGWGIQQRIGINGGRAFCGDVGGMERREYTVMGDDVNLAARLMSNASQGEILIGEKTFERLDNSISVASAGKISVKGKNQPLQVYRVECSSRVQDGVGVAMEALSAHRGPIVGRREEQAALEGFIRGVGEGEFHPVIIEGEAGIGKSRLTARFIELAKENSLNGFAGACQSYGRSIPFLPLKGVFEDILGVKGRKYDTGALNAVAESANLQGWEALLNDILELGIPETAETLGLNSRVRQQRLFDFLYSALKYRAQQGPYYIILEDVHWIDETSYEFLNHLIGEDPIGGLLILAVTRPEQAIEKSSIYSRAEIIKLEALPAEESADLIRAMLGLQEIPKALKSLVIDRSQGNPFYAGEIVRALVDEGYFTRDDSTGALSFSGNFDDIDLPDNINSLVLSRIDRLPEAAKDVIKTASVIGRSFNLELLKQIFPYEIDSETLFIHLEKLASLDLTPIDRRGADPSYVFKHIMTQEVAYNCQAFREREMLHEKIGTLLEAKYTENLHPHLEILAHHFARSANKQKAFLYLAEAGDKAVAIFANTEAIRYFDATEKIFSKRGRLPKYVSKEKVYHILRTRGSVFLRIGMYDKAAHSFSQLSEKATHWGEVELMPIALNKRAEALWLMGEYEPALSSAQEALRIAETANSSEGRASSLFSFAEIARRKGDFWSAVGKFKIAIQIYREIGNHAAVAMSLNSLGITLGATGELEQALAVYNEALKARQNLSDLEGEAKILNNMGLIYMDTGRITEALENFKKAAAAFERIGDRRNRSYCLGNIGYLQKNTANYSEAESAFLEALKVLEKVGDTAGTAYTFSNFGDLYLQMNQIDKALQYHSRALEMAITLGDEELITEVSAGLAFDNLAKGEIEKARELATKAYQDGSRIGARIYTIKALNALIEIDFASSDEKVTEYVSKLDELASGNNSEYGSAASLILGKYFQARGELLLAEKHFRNALECALKGGFKKVEWEARFMLGQILVASERKDKFFELGVNELKMAAEILRNSASKIKSPEIAESFLSHPQMRKIVDYEELIKLPENSPANNIKKGRAQRAC